MSPMPDSTGSSRSHKAGALAPIDYAGWKYTDPNDMPKEYKTEHRRLGALRDRAGLQQGDLRRGQAAEELGRVLGRQEFPGARMLADMASGTPNLEFALIADGVPMDKVFPIDIDRAFKSMSRIKPQIKKFWDTGALSAQMLADRDVVLGSIWNGRLQAIADKGAPVAIEWNQHMLSIQAYGIFKDAKEHEGRAAARRLLDEPKGECPASAKELNYGPINRKSFDLLPADMVAKLPGSPENLKRCFLQDVELVGREPRQGQFDMVEMDPVVAAAGRAGHGGRIRTARADSPHAGRGAIELRGLTKRYGDDTVVNAIAVSIAPGEFFSLLGPSGSGKTTTLMMVAGFVHPDGGAILLDGADIAAVPPQKRGFGMVFQNYAIFPHLNVFENIAFPLRARRWAKDAIAERVAWALELVRLGRFADRYARQLSGGQQQRVALARAIVFHPPVVLMDEPLGALDKNLRFEMQVEIKEIQQRLGMTVLYVTHDQEEAMSMSDRIAIMNRGRIDQVGPPGEVYEQSGQSVCRPLPRRSEPDRRHGRGAGR